MLSGFPRVNERTTTTGDNLPSENAGLNCVSACLVAGAMYLNNIPTMNATYNPDAFKDRVMGQGYVGGMAASAFIDYMKTLNIHLWSYTSTNTEYLVQEAHAQLYDGYPVIFTEKNPYGNPNYSHVCILCGETANGMVAMDPWIANFITKDDTQWAKTFIDNQLWIMERLMRIPDGWKDNGTVLTAPNGMNVQHGFRQYVITHRWDHNNWPIEQEAAAAPLEESNPALGNGTRQTFRKCVLEWEPTIGVFEGWIGVELLYYRKKNAS